MKALLWLVSTIGTLLVIALWQTAAVSSVRHLAWWASYPLVLFFGGGVAAIIAETCAKAPRPKVAAAIVLVCFLLLEAVAIGNGWQGWSLGERIVRIYADIVPLAGCFVAMRVSTQR